MKKAILLGFLIALTATNAFAKVKCSDNNSYLWCSKATGCHWNSAAAECYDPNSLTGTPVSTGSSQPADLTKSKVD